MKKIKVISEGSRGSSKVSKSIPRRKNATPFKVTDMTSENAGKCEDKPKIEKKSKKEKKKPKPPTKQLILNDQEDLEYFKEKGNFDFDEAENNSEEDEAGENYENFMEALASIDGKKKKVAATRSEGSGEVGQFNLSGHKSDKVDVKELLEAVGGKTDLRKLSKRVKSLAKPEATLPVPLEKPSADAVSRLTGYTKVKRDVAVWDAVVHSRRAADTVSFPLVTPDLRLQTAEEVARTRFKPTTPLEQQVAALLSGSKSVVRPGEELSEIEKKGLASLTAEEAAERRAELAKVRALQTYQEAKYRRQGKIKSKKFRKIARKEREKQKLKELEELERTDPEAAAEKLEEMEKTRIEERASLKHRNASKHLQFQAKRAKYNKESAQAVNDQLRHHRDLTSKKKDVSDSDKDDDDEGMEDDSQNVVIPGAKEETVDEFVSGYRKFWNEQQRKKEEVAEVDNLDDIFADAEFKLKKNIKNKLGILKGDSADTEGAVAEVAEDEDDGLQADSLNFKVRPSEDDPKAKDAPRKSEPAKEVRVDPDNFVTVEPKQLKSDLPEIVGFNEEDSENEDEQRKAIAEAFADDDVVADFASEKAAIVEANKPKDIDLSLPGWGDWGGGGIKVSKRKRRRFIIKAPPAEKRKDENKGHLILNTDKDDKIKLHQVTNVPFPFTSVSDFEASIRAPIGDTFLPRTAFLKMIKPRVKAKMGEVIEPMDKDQLVKRGLKVRD